MINDFTALVRIFSATALEGYERLKKESGLQDPYHSWRKGDIERIGQFSMNLQYEFHGVGCRICWSDRVVDFDFGPNSIIGGFDEWRLSCFQDENSAWLPVILTKSALTAAFENAKTIGLIWPKFEKLGDRSFYLSDGSG